MRLAFLFVVGLAACSSETESAYQRIEVTLAPEREFYPVTDTVRLVVTGFLSNGSNETVHGTYTSLTPTIVGVSVDRLVRALAPGTGTIEVTADGKTVRVTILVQGTLHSHAITASETWTKAAGPHVVDHDFLVGGPGNAILTIEPGTRVVFREKSALTFGEIDPGTLVIPAGGEQVVMEGDPATPGAWSGLVFSGPGHPELRNLTLRHCGGLNASGNFTGGCFSAVQKGSNQGPTVLIDNVTITDAFRAGFTVDNFSRFDPASRNLSVRNNSGFIGGVGPETLAGFPRGGQLTGSSINELYIFLGNLTTSLTLPELGVPWRIDGINVAGPDTAVLTIAPGTVIRGNSESGIAVGDNGRGRLIVGAPGGSPVVMEAASGAGWGGIRIEDGAAPSDLSNVEMKDCGQQGACLLLASGVGNGGHKLVNVTIRNSRSIGLQIVGLGRIAAGSSNLTITGSQDVPLELAMDAVGGLPSGQFTGNVTDLVRVRDQVLTESATWRNAGVPYLTPNGVHVGRTLEAPAELILLPGVEMLFPPGQLLHAIGDLKAIGTAAEPIKLRSSDPSGQSSWIGVRIGASVFPPLNKSRLEYVEIDDAGEGPADVSAAVTFESDPGNVLQNVTIRRSRTCGLVIYSEASWVTDYTLPVFGNVFVELGGPVRCSLF